MTLDDYRIQIDSRPEPTDEQWAAWHRTVSHRAPELLDMLLGDRA